MKMKRFLLTVFITFIVSPIFSLDINVAKSGIDKLPEGAVLVDAHRYYYVESSEIVKKKKGTQLKLTVRVGANYQINKVVVFSDPWVIASETRYLFSLKVGDTIIKSSSQFNLMTKLEGIRTETIEILFSIDNDFSPRDATLVFTGKPTKNLGAPIQRF
ncbi:hypothetical protein PVA45_05250 [Entomospira entomophila]|uniref:Uncharacterized protein n=1 Tax=Entomospira entomophila TaxID=2719988 RepID=A0A968KWL0_9SPIO|nr:hypothetical protein [Entomospira entomophilus]NIZ40905.1 hypothetical protein [Entomospira entomophilus]WDI35118.1 hypothetical protein PVA45_05250 [Entomospira entomophilus]